MSAAAADKLGRWLAIVGSGVALAAIVGAIFVMGTPAEQRRIRIDARRVEDLQVLVHAVRTHAREHGLPESLEAIKREPGTRLPLEDPEGRGPYEYARIDQTRFRVCATFTTDTATTRGRDDGYSPEWKHGAGRQCFVRDKRGGNAADAVVLSVPH